MQRYKKSEKCKLKSEKKEVARWQPLEKEKCKRPAICRPPNY
jgi:hypothetical protein